MPMGTIVTVCMLIGLVFGVTSLLNRPWSHLPQWLVVPASGLVFIAGAWNTFWHGLRHLTEFWGIAALLSGIVMMLTAITIYRGNAVPLWLQKIRVLVLLALFGFFLLYAITIYRL